VIRSPGWPSRRSRWLFAFTPPEGAEVRLFCFPHSGGGASAFRPWATELPSWIDLVVVEPPGRGTRIHEPVRSDLPALAGEVTAEILATGDGLPCAFLGHSVGSLLAYHAACLLAEEGRPPDLLVVSAGRAPNAVTRPVVPAGTSDDDLLAMILRFGGVPAELRDQTELLKLWIPALRADLAMFDGYRHDGRAPLPMPFVLLAGLLDDVVELEAMDGWADLTSASTSLEVFPGDHFYLLKDSLRPVLSSLTRHLSPLRARASHLEETS
jgi:surfactin synthase thioesterase subunit